MPFSKTVILVINAVSRKAFSKIGIDWIWDKDLIE